MTSSQKIFIGLAVLAAVGLPVYYKMRSHDVMPARESAASSEMLQLKNANEFNEFVNSDLSNLVVVKVSAVWCPPCQQLKPIYHDVAMQLRDKIKFAEIDIDSFDKREVLKVTGLPTVLMFKKGKEIARLEGFKTADQLKKEFALYA